MQNKSYSNAMEVTKETKDAMSTSLTVSELTATFINSVIFFSLFVRQLISIPDFKSHFFGFIVRNPLGFNICVTIVSLLIVIVLISKRTRELGHGVSYCTYGIVIACALFTMQFEPHIFQLYFNADFLCLTLVGMAVCVVGAGFKWRDVLIGVKETFTVGNVKFHFIDNIFIEDKRTLRKSIVVAVIFLIFITLLVTKHPITKLFQILGW